MDFSSCNASADLSKGCVLFNERAFNGISGLTPLNYNSSNYSSYASCNSANCDANKLISVQPDRVCGKWLSCYSYIYDQESNEKICLEMGECTAFNYDGSCFNFSKAPDGVRNYTPGRDNNASGYSLLNNDYLANMSQVGPGSILFSDNFENKANPLNNWKHFLSESDSLASTTQCLVNKPNSDIIRNSKVIYPASGQAFLRVGTGNCGGGNGNFLINNSSILLSPNSKYYLSLMTNTEDLSNDEKLYVKVIGILQGGDPDWNNSITKTFSRSKYWQENSFLIETRSNWLGGVKIILESSPNNSAYVDNIRIEPVLEAVKNNKFIPATCRLYPSQDSLLCESENKNFISNGWYGYCLQKDPKNPDVCLLWYPIDAIKGKSSESSSSFTGYPSTGGPKPYYCAQMNADFEMIEYRKAFLLTYKAYNPGSSSCMFYANFIYGYGASGCPNGYSILEVGASISHATNGSDRCNQGDDWSNSKDCVKMRYCIPTSESSSVVICDANGTDGNNNNSNPCNLYQRTQDIGALPPPFNAIPRYELFSPLPQGSWPDPPSSVNKKFDNLNLPQGWTKIPGPCFGADVDNVDNGSYDFFILTNNTGWYKYDGFASSYFRPPYFFHDEAIHGNKIWDYADSSLKNVSDYTPRCSQIVQGEIPWAQRLKNYNDSIQKLYFPNFTTHNVYNQYKLASPGNPFGAIVLGDATAPSDPVYAGKPTTTDPSAQYGLPYSCTSSREVYLSTSFQNACNSLYYNAISNRVLATTSLDSSFNTVRYTPDSNSLAFKPFLKNIWLKVTNILGGTGLWLDYNDSRFEGNTTTINSSTGSRPADDLSYKAYFPEISNVKLSNNLGIQVPASSDQIYTITNPGYYTLSFNTKVDLEQVPIANLRIRIKNTIINDWSGTDGLLEFSNLDQMSSSANPHRVIRYLNPGNYKILIKVEDNWGFYKCVGRNGFANINNLDCSNCCKNNFVTASSICESCNN